MKSLEYRVYLRWLAICLCILGSRGTLAAAEPAELLSRGMEEGIKQLVVMVRGQIRGETTNGAGIIFGTRGDRLYIATANHVVRWGKDKAEDITVELRGIPGEPLEAKLLNPHFGRDRLDLAILSVRGVKSEAIPLDLIPFDRLGDAARVERGDAVYSVGYPQGKAWRVNVNPDRIASTVGDFLRYESNVIAPGYSGGGLFNARGKLVGMIRADEPPEGEAVKINRILDAVSQWGFPVNLQLADGESERDETPTPEDKPGTDTVTELLHACEAHFNAQRLSTPAGNNALECFTEVLQLDRGNSQALEGLQRLTSTYVIWTRSALVKMNFADAASYLERLKKIAPEDPQVRQLGEELKTAEGKDVAEQKREQRERERLQAEAEQRRQRELDAQHQADLEARREADEKRRRLEERRRRAEERKRQEEASRSSGDAVLRSGDGAAIYEIVRDEYKRFASKSLGMKTPDTAENGAVIPVTLEVKSKVPGRFWLFAEQNHDPVVASLSYHVPLGNYSFSTRINTCRSGYIYGMFVPERGKALAMRRLVSVKKGGNCQPVSGKGPAIQGDIKARAKSGTFKLLIKSPMTRNAYIRTVEISGDGKRVATLTASPMISKNPYLKGNYPKVKSLIIELKGSDGSHKRKQLSVQ